MTHKRPFICASIFTGIGGANTAGQQGDEHCHRVDADGTQLHDAVCTGCGNVGILIGVLVGFFGSAISSYITFNDSMIEE